MLIERPEYLNKLIAWKDKDLIKVITGIRRCGKSVLLFDIFSDWLLTHGIQTENIIKVNLENDMNSELRNSNALYNHITTRISADRKYYVLIDEIQYIDGFETLLNSLKNMGCDVYVTGSNSKLLSGDISTALRGRSIEIKLYTLSFAEFYAYTGGDKLAAFDNYMMYGGFPFVVTENNPVIKTEYLKMLESTVATKDIIDRYNLRNENVFNAVYDFLCSNISREVSAKKICDTLRSEGYGKVAPESIANYLQHLCDAWLFHKVYRYDLKGKGYLKTLNKYYVADLGLRNAKLNYRQVEISHALENIVYLELLRRGYTVDIGKNQDKEIDFVANSLTGDKYYIQVSVTLNYPEVKERELSAFHNLDDGYKKIIVTMDNSPFTKLENGYKMLNIFDFLLNSNILSEI